MWFSSLGQSSPHALGPASRYSTIPSPPHDGHVGSVSPSQKSSSASFAGWLLDVAAEQTGFSERELAASVWFLRVICFLVIRPVADPGRSAAFALSSYALFRSIRT
jgi:hypothetical protein